MGSFNHAIFGLGLMALFYLPLRFLKIRNAHWIAMAVAVAFYWGREKRDHENRLKRPAAEVWYLGFFPWEYSPKGFADLVWPLGVCLAAALTIEYGGRRRYGEVPDDNRTEP